MIRIPMPLWSIPQQFPATSFELFLSLPFLQWQLLWFPSAGTQAAKAGFATA
jgi:hypothetical protein